MGSRLLSSGGPEELNLTPDPGPGIVYGSAIGPAVDGQEW